MRVVFMGTPDFAVPTLSRLAQDGHAIAAVYTRAPARPAAGWRCAPPPSTRWPTPRRAGADPRDAPHAGGRGRPSPATRPTSRSWSPTGCCCPRRSSTCPPRLPEPARLAAPPLAGRGADSAGGDGGRRDERCRRHADGGGARYRPGRPGGASADHGRHDGGRIARRADAAGRRADVRRAAGSRRRRPHLPAAARGGRGLRPQITNEEARIDWSRSAAEVAAHINGLSPFPGAYLEADLGKGPEAGEGAARPSRRGLGRAGHVLDGEGTVACGTGAVHLLALRRAGKGGQATGGGVRPRGAARGGCAAGMIERRVLPSPLRGGAGGGGGAG